MKRITLSVVTAIASVNLTVAPVLLAADQENSLSVTVNGEAKGKPDMMHIMLASEATAGNAVDALQQCRQKADAAATAVKALQIPNSTVIREP